MQLIGIIFVVKSFVFFPIINLDSFLQVFFLNDWESNFELSTCSAIACIRLKWYLQTFMSLNEVI